METLILNDYFLGVQTALVTLEPSLTTLKHLIFQNVEVTDYHLDIIKKIISKNPELETVEFKAVHFFENGLFTKLCPELEKLKHLKTMTFWPFKTRKRDLTPLLDILPKFETPPQLTMVNFRFTKDEESRLKPFLVKEDSYIILE